MIPDAAVGAIAAALIAGVISLLGLIISKEQKTSDFRQSWIDAIRDSFVKYLSQVNAIYDASQVEFETEKSRIEILRPLYVALNEATFNILLRLNPEEQNSKSLIVVMNDFNAAIMSENDLELSKIRALERLFIEASQIILKCEWRRVKSGEVSFRIAKLAALLVVVVYIAASLYYIYGK